MNCSITTSDNFNTYDSRLLAQQISQNLIESTSLAQSMNAEVTNPSTSSASSEEPQFKKVKLEKSEIDDQLNKNSAHFATSGHFYTTKKLEDRIGGILCCTVCLDLPQASIYQCSNGHLMCAGCFAHLLADARLKDEQATCPNCRCEISKQTCCRNLAVEKTVSELPANCLHCDVMYPRNLLDIHQKEECMERPIKCKFGQIGCNWEGPFHELDSHCAECVHPTKPAKEIMGFLQENNSKCQQEQIALNQLANFLSYEKVCFNDLQFKQYKTDEITPKLYFETNRFNAFFHQWVLKARVNDNQKNPNLTLDRYISFQLILKSKLTNSHSSFQISFCALKGPFGEVPINPRVHTFEFNQAKTETDFIKLSIKATDCNKLLASKTINFRFFMFQP
ncbi:cysteine and histidine-rich 1 [Brachionus plicatilis]|uniref:Cysteine and histidine-rich 1 n=1 Tax=Brachionus plicatilis TaxID=10195 RepID=A0A3M7S020_BRAPC|nr:cysteine and histidine-rich 1 [Brachionus plicatilis]